MRDEGAVILRFAAAVMLLAVAAAARGDDAALVASGGALKLMHGHPAIRMLSEEVHIALPDGKVEATFIFRNDGPATTVLIGFPEQGKDVMPKARTHLVNFRSWVDGKPVATKQVGRTEGDDADYTAWWVKQVPFSRGQTHTIVNRYEGGWLDTSYGCSGFQYILKTGASWHGPIGRARITVDLGSVARCWPVRFQPASGRRTGSRISWDLRNFAPKHDVFIFWFNGFAGVTVNGHPAERLINMDEHDAGWTFPSWNGDEGLPPVHSTGDVWLSASTAARWLDAKLAVVSPNRAVRLSRGVRWVEATVGSSKLHTERGDVELPDSVHVRADHLRLPLAAVARALGGSPEWDAAGRLNVRLPETKKP